MRALLWTLVSAIAIGLVAVGGMIALPLRPSGPQTDLPGDYVPPPGAGLYAVRTADCVTCHTADGEPRFAGGRAIASPLGTIYSSNITPDPEFGIGKWSVDRFRAALRDGIGGDGHNLYPAMPYASYRKLSEEDIRALYAYVMNDVEPVAKPIPETTLAFPFDQRWGLRAWKWIALETPGFTPRFADPVLDRGAYLVEGPGHCGACHSPRDALFVQEGSDSTSDTFLSGGTVNGWSVPGLRAADSAPQVWSEGEMIDFLGTGRNSHAAVVGEMHAVVAASLQFLSAEDLAAIAAYLKHIGTGRARPPEDAEPPGKATTALLTAAKPGLPLGARLYLDNCTGCHAVTGKGAPGVFPELDGNSLVNAQRSRGLVEIILHGATMPSTAKRPAALHMPGFADRLSDRDVAELATFVRSAWSNAAGPVSAGDVATIRSERAEPDD